MPVESLISGDVVAKHNTRDSCWIIVHGHVYDVTEFLDGGSKIILKYAGKDATDEYDPIHPPDAITKNLPKDKHLGKIDINTVKKVVKEITVEEKERQARVNLRPHLGEIINLHDFEAIAKLVMPEKAWAYYSSAADDEITLRENHAAYHRIWFRPRVLRDVTHVDFSTTILGQKSSMPIYITATALGKLGHPDGELNLTRAAAKHGIIQMIPTLASCSFDELVDAAIPDQSQFLQLYVNKDRARTKEFVQHAEKRGIKGLFITVDAPQLGRREKDMRMKFEDEAPNEQTKEGKDIERNQGAARAISTFIDPGLCWSDLEWFKSITKMPIILKGVQTWEDAILAANAGVQGIVLSNHGGRQLDFAPAGIEVLIDVVAKLKSELGMTLPNPNFQIFVDGGVRRATDVLKAIALGATAVGIGRPFLYAFSAYGQEGVEHALSILHDEFEMNMRLVGAITLNDIIPSMVDTRSISSHVVPVPDDRLYDNNYESMQVARLKNLKAKL
ncbi:FMN-dependent dehydrogenase-domain-containing protein [Hysterangium stoloniferum]|nr:FMN-dependent dehydrogenase-domain-containing protein [Hysterangium stoloniferum]